MFENQCVEEGSGKPGLEQLPLEMARCKIQDVYTHTCFVETADRRWNEKERGSQE